MSETTKTQQKALNLLGILSQKSNGYSAQIREQWQVLAEMLLQHQALPVVEFQEAFATDLPPV